MYFGTKSYLKSTRNHTAKHALVFVCRVLREKSNFKRRESRFVLNLYKFKYILYKIKNIFSSNLRFFIYHGESVIT
jgi:hypothetical protein